MLRLSDPTVSPGLLRQRADLHSASGFRLSRLSEIDRAALNREARDLQLPDYLVVIPHDPLRLDR